MDNFYELNEEERAELEAWLDRVNEQYREDEEFTLPEDSEFAEEATYSEEDDEELFESYDETYEDEDEVLDYQDLLDTEEAYRELNFNDD